MLVEECESGEGLNAVCVQHLYKGCSPKDTNL